MRKPFAHDTACALLLCLATATAPAQADEGDTPPRYKLSLGLYRPQAGAGDTGHDVNLRWRRDDTDAWLGLYHDATTGTQARAGWDTRWQPRDTLPLALLPSLQVASGGFAGGSLAVEVGHAWFVQAGIGRTNLKPYVNLNFDPNDALTGALGWRDEQEGQLLLSVIRDDRLHTGQQHIHLAATRELGAGRHAVFDLLHKQGRLDDGRLVKGTGFTASYEWPRWFARVAYDPYQNFGPATVWRFTGGLRF